jgi:hypothetical protein
MNAVEKILMPNIAETDSGNPLAILDRAIASGASVETLSKLMDLQERYEANRARRAYGEAMAKAQSDMRSVSADASNKQTNSNYASYHALDRAIRPIYTELGFALSFDTQDGAPPDYVRVVCRITHVGGHLETPHIDMPADGKGAKGGDVMTKTHATGAAITYGRRYLLGMIFNIAVGDDTDGNMPGDGVKLIDDAQYRYLQDLIEKSNSVEAKLLEFFKLEKLEDMNQQQYKLAESKMRKRIAAAGDK